MSARLGLNRHAFSLGGASGALRSALRPIPLGAGLLALAGILVVLYATPFGPWVYSDSTEYIVSARNFLKGLGMGLVQASGEYQTLSLHPPLYPMTLALGGLAGADLVDWARWLNATLFGVTILLAAGIVAYATGSPWLALGAGLVFLVHPGLVELYTGAMSEPLFFVAGLGGLLLLLVYLNRGRAWQLLGAGVACGLALLTRYPGVAFVAAGEAGLLIFSKSGRRQRLRDAAIFLVLAAVPLSLWQIWLASQPDATPSWQWNLRVGDLWQALTPFRIELVQVVWGWIPYHPHLPPLPYWLKPRSMLAVGLILTALVVAAAARISRRERAPWRRARSLQLAVLASAFALFSVGVLAAVFVYSVPALDRADIDRRMLLPPHIGLTLAGFGLAHLAMRAWPQVRAIPWLAAVGILLSASWYLPQSWEFVTDLRRAGAGYTGLTWRNSPTLNAVQAFPPELPLITNESAALTFLLDRPAYDLPELVQGVKLRSYARFGEGQDHEERLFREEGAALVLFNSAYLHFYRIYEAGTEDRLEALVQGLQLKALYEDGAIYFYQPLTE